MRRLLPKRFQYDPVGLGYFLAEATLVVAVVMMALSLILSWWLT